MSVMNAAETAFIHARMNPIQPSPRTRMMGPFATDEQDGASTAIPPGSHQRTVPKGPRVERMGEGGRTSCSSPIRPTETSRDTIAGEPTDALGAGSYHTPGTRPAGAEPSTMVHGIRCTCEGLSPN